MYMHDINKENILNICACMGPKLGEPYCQCKMISVGLKTKEDYAPSQKQRDKLKEAFALIFDRRSNDGFQSP